MSTSSESSSPPAPGGIAVAASSIASSVTGAVQKISPTTAHLGGLILNSVIACIFIVIVVWTRGKRERNDASMLAEYEESVKPSPINDFEDRFAYLLRDYYIMTAYNCCCSGDYSADFVSTTALECVIKQGARVLDFEIYSVDGVPVVAASSKAEFSMKEVYNYITFMDAILTIKKLAFSSNGCQNPSDPLFLCLRIKSKNVMIYESIATILKNNLASKMLDPRFSYSREDIGSIKLSNFMNKVIIIIDENPGSDNNNTKDIYKRTPLYEYVNMTITMDVSKYTFQKIKDTNNTSIRESAKKSIKYIVPERSVKCENVEPATLSFNAGCQMVCMAFQSYDANMIHYLKKFQSFGSAFYLKPEELRYVPIILKEPNPVDPTETLSSKQTATTVTGGTYSLG
jgi:hypothetical protein